MPSTQTFTDLDDIINDIILLKGGYAAMVLEVGAINFGLFSEREQDATLYAYAQLLNSLTFSMQIVISSKRKDITDYIKRVDEYLAKTHSPKLAEQITKYREFIKAIVRQSNVLDKKFYVVIPYSVLETGVGSALSNLLTPKSSSSVPKEEFATRAINNLAPKRDHLIRLLARIGLRTRQLTGQELIQLFYEFYNPDDIGVKTVLPSEVKPEPSPPTTQPSTTVSDNTLFTKI